MPGESFPQIDNQSATNGDIWDSLSRDADASDNPFEIDDRDSTDITAEFNDNVAQEKEAELGNPYNGELPGNILDPEETNPETIEYDITPATYREFGKENLDTLFNALKNEANAGEVDQKMITEEILATIAVMNSADAMEAEFSTADDLFDKLTNNTREPYETAKAAGLEAQARVLNDQVKAIEAVKKSFMNFLKQTPVAPIETPAPTGAGTLETVIE